MDPQVQIPQGILQGKTMTSRKGRGIRAFQGIPYAKPPVGDLRFRSPCEAPGWDGVRMAQKEGSASTQKHFVTRQFGGSEDCLYLNVYSPQEPKTTEKLPVMVWIHGGGFFASSGSSEMFGPEFLLDHDVVLVTINYRLGTLGFLNLGTTEVPGNFGLKDQVAALKWVKNNIERFGGDSNLVTIFGESAGGASVHYLLVSPLAKGLFHRAIVQSGAATNPWAFYDPEESKMLCKEVCKELHCLKDDGSLDLNLLKSVSAQKCAEEGRNLKDKYKLKVELVPTVESENVNDPFLTRHPRLLEIADVPLMIGVTSHEGMIDLTSMKSPAELEEHHNKNFFDYVPYKELGIEKDSPECLQKFRELNQFYDKFTNGDFIEKFIHIISDKDFMSGVDDLVRATASNVNRKQPIFYYQFSYDGNLSFFKKLFDITKKGACHTDELCYLFTMDFTPWKEEISAADLQKIEQMTKLWTDFAKYGNPTPSASQNEIVWDPIVATDKGADSVNTRYLEIGDNMLMNSKSMNEERMKFWREFSGQQNSAQDGKAKL